MRRRRIVIKLAATAAALGLGCVPTVMAASPAGATTETGASPQVCLQLITGSGSTWAQNAVDEWISNVQTQLGLQVVFNGVGSASGRQEYAEGTVDFAVSDVGYQGDNSEAGDDVSNRPYAYLPVTSGGTAFPYNILIAGKRLINLRLSGSVLAQIFTNHITNWDNPEITANNNGFPDLPQHHLPNLPIITVVPSEGSGTTAMFTQYLAKMFPTYWTPFNGGNSGWTEFWPRQGTSQVAEDGSTQVMNYVASSAADGSIGIDQYSYPKGAGFPVVQVENQAGYYTLPSEYNVAVALEKATLNTNKSSINYLLQNLNGVYVDSDPRTYPLSSYSYTIMPTAKNDPRMEVAAGQCPAKWQTLADFLYYSICQGQENIGPVGYSALPVNLVEDGFQQIDKIKQAAPAVQIASQNIKTCNNPTFVAGHPSENYLAQIAPQPPSCDKNGQGPCVGTLNANANGGKQPNTTASSAPTTGPSASSSSSTATGGSNTGSSDTSSSSNDNPATGQGSGSSSGSGGPVNPQGASLTAGESGIDDDVLYALAALLLLCVLVAPPLLSWFWSGPRSRR
jgi:phosphate transport system substrate-binding protein